MATGPELNQVSKMSSSWRSSAAGRAHTSQAFGPAGSADTVVCPSGQYQAGIRWPHHSWRLTFQSRISVIQCSQTFTKRSGRICVVPERVASRAAAASGATRMNHWVLSRGSTTSSERWQWPISISWALIDSRSPRSCERLHDPAASLVAVQAGELGAVLVDTGGVVQHGDHRQAVALAGLVVVLVVGRGDLDRARAEGPVHHRVGDDRHRPIHERDHGLAADQRGVSRVVGVDRNRRVAQQRLRTRGRDGDPGVRVRRPGRVVDEVVAHCPQAARRFLRDDLQVRNARPAAGAPVD